MELTGCPKIYKEPKNMTEKDSYSLCASFSLMPLFCLKSIRCKNLAELLIFLKVLG